MQIRIVSFSSNILSNAVEDANHWLSSWDGDESLHILEVKVTHHDDNPDNRVTILIVYEEYDSDDLPF